MGDVRRTHTSARNPYPFLDPDNGGYGTVALYSVGTVALLLGVIWVAATTGPALRARRRDP
jgi:hypothetical protein